MFLYNITYNIEHAAHDEWIQWMKNTHVPAVLATNLPIGNRIFKLLTEIDNGGVTYSFQFFFADQEDYNTYITEHSSRLAAEVDRRYGSQYVVFRTLLQEIV
ncbi:DUF4286 family protein [Siphonobacter sp.]|uniref:DUF4286 family protein n=1 Tax=Siphonobacter sp. TaxID=1869184 RepID=UPI003B3A9CC1